MLKLRLIVVMVVLAALFGCGESDTDTSTPVNFSIFDGLPSDTPGPPKFEGTLDPLGYFQGLGEFTVIQSDDGSSYRAYFQAALKKKENQAESIGFKINLGNLEDTNVVSELVLRNRDEVDTSSISG